MLGFSNIKLVPDNYVDYMVKILSIPWIMDHFYPLQENQQNAADSNESASAEIKFNICWNEIQGIKELTHGI